MTTTLTTGINDSDRILVVTSDEELPAPNSVLRIGDEAIIFHGPDRGSVAAIRDVLDGDTDHWRVTRGAAGTTAAAHLSGAAIVATAPAIVSGEDLEPPSPFAGGGAPTLADTLAEGNDTGGTPIRRVVTSGAAQLLVESSSGDADATTQLSSITETGQPATSVVSARSAIGSFAQLVATALDGEGGYVGVTFADGVANAEPGSVVVAGDFENGPFMRWGRLPNSAEIVITEDASGAAGTYTGSITVPGGATITDVQVSAVVPWTLDQSAALSVGDENNEAGFVSAWSLGNLDDINLTHAFSGGGGGTYFGTPRQRMRMTEDHQVLIKVVVTGDPNLTPGAEVCVLVTWSLPPSTAATFEAAA